MLFTQTVTPACYTLIQDLTDIPDLADFRLAGGTALALQKGHRLSVDIDMFSHADFDTPKILRALEAYLYPRRATEVRTFPFGFFCNIEEIKADFMFWGDPFVKPALVVDGIRMVDPLEILAMKLHAVTTRKTKKDFVDIALLLHDFNLQQGLDCYVEKYPYNDVSAALKQLVYFDAAEDTPDPEYLIPTVWQDVKEKIASAVKIFWKEQLHE